MDQTNPNFLKINLNLEEMDVKFRIYGTRSEFSFWLLMDTPVRILTSHLNYINN
jgi:hypothetical protein